MTEELAQRVEPHEVCSPIKRRLTCIGALLVLVAIVAIFTALIVGERLSTNRQTPYSSPAPEVLHFRP
jgi:hypothetical protein